MPNVLFINGIRDNARVKVHKIVDNNTLQFINEGTCNVCKLLNSGAFNKSILLLDAKPSQTLNLHDIDLVFNQISDGDSHSISITKAQAVCQQLEKSIYCINHPDKILKTSRQHLAERLKNFPEIVIPETIKFKPASALQIAEKIEQLNWKYPVLIRQTGNHNAKSLILLKSADEIKKLHPSYFEFECYLTEFINFSDEKGVFTKYRFVSVNGKSFIRHIMYGDQWEIHSHVRKKFMTANSEYFNLEEETLASFEYELKPRIETAMQKIHGATGLEYFGVDCSIDEQGRLIIFEANANMNLLYNPYPKPNAWQTQVDAIQHALVEMIEGLVNARTD